jgi:hypothetical protein
MTFHLASEIGDVLEHALVAPATEAPAEAPAA